MMKTPRNAKLISNLLAVSVGSLLVATLGAQVASTAAPLALTPVHRIQHVVAVRLTQAPPVADAASAGVPKVAPAHRKGFANRLHQAGGDLGATVAPILYWPGQFVVVLGGGLFWIGIGEVEVDSWHWEFGSSGDDGFAAIGNNWQVKIQRHGSVRIYSPGSLPTGCAAIGTIQAGDYVMIDAQTGSAVEAGPSVDCQHLVGRLTIGGL